MNTNRFLTRTSQMDTKDGYSDTKGVSMTTTTIATMTTVLSENSFHALMFLVLSWYLHVIFILFHFDFFLQSYYTNSIN